MCIVPGRGFSGLSGRHYVVRLMEHKDDGYLLGLQRDTRLPATTGPTRLIMQSCSGHSSCYLLLYNHPVNPVSVNYIIYQLCRMMSSDIKVRKLHLLSHCVVLGLFYSFYTDEKWILESRNKTNDQSFDFGCCQCWKYLFI